MGVTGFDAAMLAGWMKSMRTMYSKKEKKAKGKSGAAPPVLNSRQRWVVDTFKFLRPHLKVGKQKGHGVGKFHYLLLFIYLLF